MTRVSLLVRTADANPRIADYAGRGALLSWVRVTATRLAVKSFAPDERQVPEEAATAALGALPAPGVDAELDLIKRRHHREFHEAVREAFATLPDDDRHLLQLYFIDRLSTPELGALFRVNQSTVSRWLKTARQAIYDETKRRLQERFGLSTREFTSLMAVLDSELDMSLSQIFGKTPEPDGPERQ
jgi:RNA polymerase sigma-70 factor (ECF subfamily)